MDGVYGKRHGESAVKLFEQAYGKTPTGIATVSLQKTLYSDDARSPMRRRRRRPNPRYIQSESGDNGLRVMALQNRLEGLGLLHRRRGRKVRLRHRQGGQAV